jgi:hypothetical protein
VDYRDLIEDVLESIEHGLDAERKRGTLNHDEAEVRRRRFSVFFGMLTLRIGSPTEAADAQDAAVDGAPTCMCILTFPCMPRSRSIYRYFIPHLSLHTCHLTSLHLIPTLIYIPTSIHLSIYPYIPTSILLLLLHSTTCLSLATSQLSTITHYLSHLPLTSHSLFIMDSFAGSMRVRRGRCVHIVYSSLVTVELG